MAAQSRGRVGRRWHPAPARSTTPGTGHRVCRGWHPAPARGTAPGADRARAPAVPAQAGLYMQGLSQPELASPHSHCWNCCSTCRNSYCWEWKEWKERESSASLPALFVLAGISPSSCPAIRECCCLWVTHNRGWGLTSGLVQP